MSFDLSSGSQPLLRGPQVPINMPKTENSLYTGSLWYHIYVPAVEKAFGAMKIYLLLYYIVKPTAQLFGK